MDELFESLTLIQTGKVRHFPLVLMGKDYWEGLVTWLEERMAHEGKIAPKDLDLFLLTDDPQEARDHIVNRYRRRRELMAGRQPEEQGPEL
jgi:hypothetical protein